MSEQDFDQIEELGDEDLLEEDGEGEPRAQRTLKMNRDEFNRAQALAAAMGPTAPAIPPAPNTSPILEPLRARPHAHPASIAPVAIDTNPLPTLPPPARLPVVQAAPPPQKKGSALPWILGAAAVFMLVAVGGSVAGYMVVSKSNDGATASASSGDKSDREAKTAEVDHANSKTVDTTPATAPNKADQAPGEVPTLNVGSLPVAAPKAASGGGGGGGVAPAAKPEPVATKTTSQPEPAAAPAPKPAQPAAAADKPVQPAKPTATTGVIKLPDGSKALTVIVDGGYHRVNDQGYAVVKCGHHSVRAGTSSTQEIDVPCGGMVTLQ